MNLVNSESISCLELQVTVSISMHISRQMSSGYHATIQVLLLLSFIDAIEFCEIFNAILKTLRAVAETCKIWLWRLELNTALYGSSEVSHACSYQYTN